MLTSKDNFLHLLKAEIEEFYKISIPDYTEEKQIVYILSRHLLGIYEKKLYVNFLCGKVVDYKVFYYIFNKKLI
ncbi:hypothetical protein N6B72_01220 [Chryseobacterium soli]|uniref:hypothetical protein n=1 Tax=Chryseobacterium soli TaxID=445961 RepID=UPI002953BD33|nr:hypothetical protein [Chryseobacterium soli]MDV7695527.1 hypothetical protein [Chryseobacterium soli]